MIRYLYRFVSGQPLSDKHYTVEPPQPPHTHIIPSMRAYPKAWDYALEGDVFTFAIDGIDFKIVRGVGLYFTLSIKAKTVWQRVGGYFEPPEIMPAARRLVAYYQAKD